jgi:arylsulfatase A-like enzyme
MARKPHIVLLMADQMRFDCLSAYGELGVKTPQMDALAKESVVFERAYCASPLCVPTRGAIAAGKWPHRTGVIVNGSFSDFEKPFSILPAEHRTYHEQLMEGGYRISKVGVQHVKGLPKRVPGARILGEAEWVAYLKKKGLAPPAYDSERRPCQEFANGEMTVKGFHPTTFVRETEFGAEDFMDVYWSRLMGEVIGESDVSQPNAWIFNGWAPHPPFWVPEPYYSMYDPAAIKLPGNVGQWYPGQPPFLLHTASCKSVQLKADGWRKTWAAYFGLVTMMDDCMGRVIGALKERGVWDDSLVIFVMDHGECLGAHSLSGKQVMYEESARVPLMIKPPGGAGAGTRRKQVANHVDLAATICDYAGVAAPPGQQGRSLRAPIEDAGAAWHDATFAEFHGDQGRGYPTRAIFMERYKYIFHFCGPDELYDVAADPLEAKSLAGEAAFAGVKAELKGRLAKWMKETGDFLDMERDAKFTPRDWPEVGLRLRPAKT